MTMITFNKRLGQSAHLSKVLENNTMYIPSNPGGELYQLQGQYASKISDKELIKERFFTYALH